MSGQIFSQVINASFLNPFSYIDITITALILSLILLFVMLWFIREFYKKPDLVIARIRLYKNVWIMFLLILFIDIFIIISTYYVLFINPLMLIYVFWSLGYISLGAIVAYICSIAFILYLIKRKGTKLI